MLTITRFHNSVSAAAAMRRSVAFAVAYAAGRAAFGAPLERAPLHVRTLGGMDVEARAATLLVLEMARLLGRSEAKAATAAEESVLRVMTPVMKLFTAKRAVSVASEGVEALGGVGYVEETGVPGVLRDAQVLPIWEGTTNVLSLDVARAVKKSGGGVLDALFADVERRVATAHGAPELRAAAAAVVAATASLRRGVGEIFADEMLTAARELALSLGRVFCGALLVEHAAATRGDDDALAAARWVEAPLVEFKIRSARDVAAEHRLVFGSRL